MKLSNRFPDDEKMRVWLDHQHCVLCGSNNNLSLHHIDGCKQEYHRSIFNSSMLCHDCHKKADGHNTDSKLSEDFRKELREKTFSIIGDKPRNKYDIEYLASVS